MAGYEEAVTDPSYAAQVLTFSYPLDRQLRRRRVAAWSPNACGREGVVTRRIAARVRAWLERRGTSWRSRTSTPAPSSGTYAPRERCAARSARPRPTSCSSGRSREPHIDYERALAEPRPGASAARLCSPARRSRTRSERARGSPSSTSAASARSCGGSPERGLEVAVLPAVRGCRRDPRARPEGGARGQRAGRPAAAHGRHRDRA